MPRYTIPDPCRTPVVVEPSADYSSYELRKQAEVTSPRLGLEESVQRQRQNMNNGREIVLTHADIIKIIITIIIVTIAVVIISVSYQPAKQLSHSQGK